MNRRQLLIPLLAALLLLTAAQSPGAAASGSASDMGAQAAAISGPGPASAPEANPASGPESGHPADIPARPEFAPPVKDQSGGSSAFSPDASVAALAPAFARELDNTRCYQCHTNPDLRPATERGAGLNIVIPRDGYEKSVHGSMNCVACHAPGARPADFDAIPHTLNREALPSCMNCHDKAFSHVRGELAQSRHFQTHGDKIACADCHDPHAQRRVEPVDSYLASVKDANESCINCHTSKIRYQELTGKAVYTQNLAHEFLPKRDRHFASVRCVDCHTPADAVSPKVHSILPKAESLRDCAACHTDENSFFVARVRSFTDGQQGPGSFVGKGLFDDTELIKKMREADITPALGGRFPGRVVSEREVKAELADAYVPGLGQTAALDGKVNAFLFLVFAGLLAHGLIRAAARRVKGAPIPADAPGERIYPAGVRLLHWTNAAFFLTLLATGFSIHYPDAALSLPLESSVDAHNAAGLLLAANFTAFLFYSLLSGEIRQYIPTPKGLAGRLIAQLDYYLRGIFTGADKPFHPTAKERMNPVQQLTYLLAYCLGMPVLIASGLLLTAPELAERFAPGASTRALATAHYILAAGYLAFAMLHLYMTTTGTRALSLIKGIITGRHYE